MLTILAGALPAILGLLTSFLPNLVRYLERGQQYKHEIALTQLRMEAAREGMDFKLITDGIKAVVEEGESVRSHDSDLIYSGWINDLRASVRPLVTYLFFFLFIGVKAAAAALMFREGYDGMKVLAAIWDPYTISIFGAIIGFWFGTRSMVYVNETFFGTERREVIRKPTGQRGAGIKA